MHRKRIPGRALQGACNLTVAMAVIFAAVAGVPGCGAQELFTRSYLLPTEDPRCMVLQWQTDTAACDGWVYWGYYGQPQHNSVQATPWHQNLKNDSCSSCAAQDIQVWQAEICGATPGLPISAHIYASYPDGFGQCAAWEDWTNDFVLPLDPAARHLTFYGYGDTRDCGSDFQRVSQAILTDVGGTSTDPAYRKTVLLHSGDAVYNGGQSFYSYSNNTWLNYLSKYDAAKTLHGWMPVAMAMGNHDFHWDGQGDYPKYFYMDFPYEQYDKSIGMVPYIDDDGKLKAPGDTKAMDDAYYSFDYGPIHVAVVNNYTSGETNDLGGCYYGSGLQSGKAQSTWLQQDLASSNKPWKILLMHVPPISCDCSMAAADANSRANLESIAASHGVSLILMGHAHYFQALAHRDNRIWHIALGGGGAAMDSDCNGLSYCVACDDPLVCPTCAGGYDSGSRPCLGCFFHYAKFYVVDDDRMDVDVRRVDAAGNQSTADYLILHRGAPNASSASFKVVSRADYKTPIRLTCTTEGAHGSHLWDLGDGTTSSEENPLHTYPKPTEAGGYHTYHVTFTARSGSGQTIQASQDVTIFAGAILRVLPDVNDDTKFALYVTPPGQPFNEGDFWTLGEGNEGLAFAMAPGQYLVTLRALGYDDWQGTADVPPDGTLMFYPQPRQHLYPGANVAIGSVPPGAEVTINPGTSHQVSGTTPFYAMACGDWNQFSCISPASFTYRVTNGAVIVERTGDYQYDYEYGTCLGPCQRASMSQNYVDVRAPSGAEQSRLPILRGPSDQQIVKNGSALVRVETRSREPVTYRWFEGESGDTSRPIAGATSAVYATLSLKEARPYWVRVYSGIQNRDSRTATVSVASKGPVLLFAKRKKVCPGSAVTLKGRGFNPEDPGENRIFFDEMEAHAEAVRRNHVTVVVPKELAGRGSALVRVKANGVWSKPRKVRIAACGGTDR